jgi:hypothetical protein
MTNVRTARAWAAPRPRRHGNCHPASGPGRAPASHGTQWPGCRPALKGRPVPLLGRQPRARPRATSAVGRPARHRPRPVRRLACADPDPQGGRRRAKKGETHQASAALGATNLPCGAHSGAKTGPGANRVLARWARKRGVGRSMGLRGACAVRDVLGPWQPPALSRSIRLRAPCPLRRARGRR